MQKVNVKKREEFAISVVLLRCFLSNISDEAKNQPKYNEMDTMSTELYQAFVGYFTADYNKALCSQFSNDLEAYLNNLTFTVNENHLIEYLVNAIISVFVKRLKVLKNTDEDWHIVSESKISEIEFYKSGLLVDRRLHKPICEYIDKFITNFKID